MYLFKRKIIFYSKGKVIVPFLYKFIPSVFYQKEWNLMFWKEYCDPINITYQTRIVINRLILYMDRYHNVGKEGNNYFQK